MSPAADAPGASLEVHNGDPASLRFTLRGRLDTWSVGPLWRQGSRAIEQHPGTALSIDASRIEYCDTAGAAMLVDLDAACVKQGGTSRLEGFPETFQPILDLVRPELRPPVVHEPAPPLEIFTVEVGRRTVQFLRDCAELVRFVGAVTAAVGSAIVHPHRVRWADTLRAIQTTGVEAFPVVLLVTTLLGMILAYQSADTLHRFGADNLLPYGLALSLVRELGPLMTAIVLTARSGSAFAAEIGTMQVNEELDALTTMGLDPVRFLVTPRLIAAVVITPVLTIFANVAGLGGGAFVAWLQLDIPLVTFNREVLAALDLGDLLTGLFKAFVFGVLVAAVGCFRGIRTRGGAVGVGTATTSAVVTGIVLIAVADALFAILFYHLGV